MTAPGARRTGADVEQELTARLRELARAFIADLTAQGRLVESGGAQSLEELRGHQPAPGRLSQGRLPTSGPTFAGDAFDTGDAGNAGNTGDAGDAGDAGNTGNTEDAGNTGNAWDTGDAADSGTTEDGSSRTPQTPIPSWATVDAAGITWISAGASVVHPRPAAPTSGWGEGTPASGDRGAPPAAVDASHPLHALYASAASGTVEAPEPAAPAPTGPRQDQSPSALLAARLRAEHAGRLEVTRIAFDQESVSVDIQALSLDDWYYWLGETGATPDAAAHHTEGARTATGHLDGVVVHLTAYDVPRLLHRDSHPQDGG
ncbi:BN159_2729 family protein [Streptomyces anandii]|uniref:BN159_2729 family protein n=1 Tax=Streptomyces anandii TaxID=285454 RepID=UPI0036F6E836